MPLQPPWRRGKQRWGMGTPGSTTCGTSAGSPHPSSARSATTRCSSTARTAPGGSQPEVVPGELVGGRFWKPADALGTRGGRGSILLVPPVVIVLEHMVAGGGEPERWIPALDATARSYLAGRLHRARFVPDIVLAPVRTPTIPPATTTNCYLLGNEQPVDPRPRQPGCRGNRRRLLRPGGGAGAGEGHHPHRDPGLPPPPRPRRWRCRPGPGHWAGRCTPTPSPWSACLSPAPTCGPSPMEIVFPLGRRTPDGQWTVAASQRLHTPGHDRGHLVFHEDRYHAVLAADLASTVSTIMVDPPEGDLRRLPDEPGAPDWTLPDGMLHPAHGPAVRSSPQAAAALPAPPEPAGNPPSGRARADSARPPSTPLVPEVYWDTQPQQLPVRRPVPVGQPAQARDRREGAARQPPGDGPPGDGPPG